MMKMLEMMGNDENVGNVGNDENDGNVGNDGK